MVRFISRVVVALAMVLTSVLVAPAPAQAATTCFVHTLATAYGPVNTCTLTSGTSGRAAYHSRITGEYAYVIGWLPSSGSILNQDTVLATDGVRALFVGGKALTTPYGPASFGTQLRISDGRFGWWNLITNRFYPTSGWLQRV